jgi:hypothetical protein
MDGRPAKGCDARTVGGVQVRRATGTVRLETIETAGDKKVRAVAVDLEGDRADERG